MAVNKTLSDFLDGKSPVTINLYNHFVKSFKEIGDITLHPAKTMIGVSNGKRRIAWITAFGKNFIHVVFPFKKSYHDNLCFQKIAQVPGDTHQFNHHYRMLYADDINNEVKDFMKMAFNEEEQCDHKL